MSSTGKRLDENRFPDVNQFAGYEVVGWIKGFRPMETRTNQIAIYTAKKDSTLAAFVFLAPMKAFTDQPLANFDVLRGQAEHTLETTLREGIEDGEECFFELREGKFMRVSQPNWWTATLLSEY